jgi:trk system potassium uptake protein TrkA
MEKRRVLVIGMGRFGMALAETAQAEGAEIVAVDVHIDPIDQIKDSVSQALCLDATDIDALRDIDAGSCDLAVVAMGESFESSVLCVHALKELGLKQIWARAHDARQGKILTAIGATQIIEIETDLGRRMGKALVTG